MNTVVCIKQVPDPELPVTAIVEKQQQRYILNPYDEVALEEAVRIKEKVGQGMVRAITIGPPSAEKTLRKCLAIGADDVIHVCNNVFDYLNPYATALILAKVIATLKYDIIFCGFRSVDWGSSAVGSIVAELLDLPVATGVIKLDISSDAKSAIASRRLAGGNREIVQCALPAVFTVEKALNTPRYPSVRRVIMASKKEIPKHDFGSLGLEQESVNSAVSLTKVLGISSRRPPQKIFTPSSDLPPAERMKQLMSGGTSKAGGHVLKKPADEAAKEIVRFLIHTKVIS